MMDITLPEDVDFSLTKPLVDSNGEKAIIVQMKCFPVKAFSKTAKTRQALFSTILSFQSKISQLTSGDTPESTPSESTDNAMDGSTLSKAIMATEVFDIEVNIKRFINLCESYDLLQIDGKPFTMIQYNDISPIDVESMMYEYMAVFLYPYVEQTMS
jgi:hypothetical protein